MFGLIITTSAKITPNDGLISLVYKGIPPKSFSFRFRNYSNLPRDFFFFFWGGAWVVHETRTREVDCSWSESKFDVC